MLRRLLWLGVGIGIGVVVVRTITKQARKLSPAGLAGSAQEGVGRLTGTVRNFVDDVVDGMHEREDEIHEAFAQGIALDTVDIPWARDVGGKFSTFKQELEDGS